MTKPRLFLVKLILFIMVLGLASPAYCQNTNLVSNVDGKIKVVIFHYGNGAYFDGFWFDMSALFRDLLKKMDSDVAFVVLHGADDNAQKVKKALAPFNSQKLPDGTKRVKYLQVDVKTGDFYPWARDGYFIQKDANGNLVFLDSGFNFKPYPVSNFTKVFKNAVVRAAIIPRGGGNVRTTDNEIFIGMDTILGIDVTPRWSPHGHIRESLYNIAEQYQASDTTDLKNKFNAYADFLHNSFAPDKRLVVPGKELFFEELENGTFLFTKKTVHHTGAQAAYHTDVYLTLGHIDNDGKRILFIADSSLGAQIVAKITPARRREIEEKLPDLLAKEGFTAAGIPVSGEQIAKRFQWSKHKLLDLCLETAKETKKPLDTVAQTLQSKGYRIIRIPYLPNGLNNNNHKNDRAMGVSFSYSNVLTEVYKGVRKVYIPSYGFMELDKAAAAAYEKAGYEVVFIKGLLTSALTSRNDGKGLDCLTSEIRMPVQWAK